MSLRGKTASDLLRQALRETACGLCGGPLPAGRSATAPPKSDGSWAVYAQPVPAPYKRPSLTSTLLEGEVLCGDCGRAVAGAICGRRGARG